MKKILSILISIVIAAVILFAAALWLIPNSMANVWQSWGLPQASLTPLQRLRGQVVAPQETRLYGTLETRTVHVMSELPGRAVAVLVTEGDRVTAGDPLIRLDPTDVQAQVAAAKEALVAAEAARDAVAAPPDETVQRLADEAVAKARVDVENAQRAQKQAQEMLTDPQAIQSQIDQTAALIPVAKADVDAAKAGVKQVQVLIDNAKNDGSMQGQYRVQILQAQKAAAVAEQKAAQARLDGLYRTLALLKTWRDHPLALAAKVHQAQGQLQIAEAALKVAQAERDAQTAPPQPERIAVAEADVQKARAALDLARWREDKLVITAPISGRVQASLIATGETIQPGLPLLTLADTSRLEVWAYVSEQDLHRVHVGDALPVEVLALPGQRFAGQVFYIAPESQFRPTNVLNPDDRAEMVFQIKLYLNNGDGQLKPGMPADVILPAP